MDDVDRALEDLEVGLVEEEDVQSSEHEVHGQAIGADNIEGLVDERDEMEEDE